MDADAAPGSSALEHDEEEWDGTEEMRKRKLDEYMDELYGLEFNDIVSIRSYSISCFANRCLAIIGCGHSHSVQVRSSR